MAARNNAIFLPLLTDKSSSSTKAHEMAGKPFGNFGAYVSLPSLDPQQNMNVFYELKTICKIVCEWYVSWKPWQREILLCSLSGKCSVSHLSTLSTILEPVFHRDFVSRLHGRYPIKCLKQQEKVDGDRNCPKFNNMEKKNRTKQEKSVQGKAGKIMLKQNENVDTDGVRKRLKHDVSINNRMFGSEESARKKSLSLSELLKGNISRSLDGTTQSSIKETKVISDLLDVVGTSPKNLADARSSHSHNNDIYKKDKSKRFFSPSRITSLSDMKASLQAGRTTSNVRRRISDLDARCYKHAKWWTSLDSTDKRLVSAHGSKLWNHFARQLKEINEKMDNWSDPERVNLLSEVIKSSEPAQISFFAQCLIQRLRDRSDVSVLPDRTILKIFAKLDVKTLCQVSQVSRRWRYLGEDTTLWKLKCIQLGWLKGIKNLVLLIERSANNSCVDWKHAYKEVYEIFHEKPVQDDSTARNMSGRQRPITPKYEIIKEKDLQLPVEIPTKQSVELEGKDKTMTDKVDIEMVTKVDIMAGGFDEDITGGGLHLLEDSLFELTEAMQPVSRQEELALDVRPLKVQARNEMDTSPEENYKKITVAVEDVKSVKRVRKIQGHMDGVFCVQFDAKRCLTGSADRVLRMWDVRSGKGIRKMFGHSGGIRCAQFDRTKIMSGSWDSTIMVWDIVKFTRLGVLYGHEGCVSCLQFNSKYVVSGSHDQTARVWDVNTWECLRVLQGHQGEVTCLYLGGHILLTGSTDRTIKVWNIETGKCLDTLVGHETAVLSLKATRALVISGSEDGKIMFWNIESSQLEAVIEGHDGPCHCLFIWDSHFLSGGGDHIIKEWDISTLTCLRSLQGHQGAVYCVKMSSERIVSSSEDGTVRIWDLEVPVQQIGKDFDDDDETLLPFNTLDCEKGDDLEERAKTAEEEFWDTWRGRSEMGSNCSRIN